MDRAEKAATIEEIAAQIEGSEAIFAVDYRGISVAQAAELRGKLREADASFRVVKNRLTKLAAEKAGEGRLAELLDGPTALTFVRGDTAQAAKAISTFNRANDLLAFKGGFMDALTLDEDKFQSIARLPARPVLDGQLAGMVASPLTGLVRGLGSMIQGLALQLGQIAEQGLVSGAAPEAADRGEEASRSDSSPPSEGAPEPEHGDGEPAAEAEPSTAAAEDERPAAAEDAGPADAPVEEPPTESEAGAETAAEGDPSQAEGDEGDAVPRQTEQADGVPAGQGAEEPDQGGEQPAEPEDRSEATSQLDSLSPSEEASETEQAQANPPAAEAERSRPAEADEDEASETSNENEEDDQ